MQSTPSSSNVLLKERGPLLFKYTGQGASSFKSVEVQVYAGNPGTGINFVLSNDKTDNGTKQVVPAQAQYVVSTVRNVVLGKDGFRVCFVEHILAAACFWGANDLVIEVDGPEIPLADGSAKFWIELFEGSGLARKLPSPCYELKEPIEVRQADKQVTAIPAESFSMAYLMDWPHPAIGKRWARWSYNDPIADIVQARTFGLKSEHDLLGMGDNFVSITENGFSKPLNSEDEPVRHKLLDLFGDLSLSGINPLSIKAQFISIKAGHTLDIEMAKKLQIAFERS